MKFPFKCVIGPYHSFRSAVDGGYFERISHYTSTDSDSSERCNVTMTTMASPITVVYSIVYSDADQRKHQSSPSLTFVRGIHRWPVNSPHKWPVTRKKFPFDDVIMHFWSVMACLHGNGNSPLSGQIIRLKSKICRIINCKDFKGHAYVKAILDSRWDEKVYQDTYMAGIKALH